MFQLLLLFFSRSNSGYVARGFLFIGLCVSCSFAPEALSDQRGNEKGDERANTFSRIAADWALYLEPFYGTAIIDQIQGTGIGTGELILGEIDGRLRQGRQDDGVAGLGVRLEREFNNWHLGLSFAWRYRTDWDLTASTLSIRSVTNIFSDVETRSVNLLFGRHWWRGNNRWGIEAGAGLVRNRIESELLERAVPGERGQLRFEAKRTPRDFAWNLGLSWHRKLGESWQIGTRYQYSNLGDLATGEFESRNASATARHRSHDVVVSLGRRF